MPKNDIHVTYRRELGKWAAKPENQDRASRLSDTKDLAMDYARQRAKADKVEVVPHHKWNGRITNPNSYGNDPRAIKDKRH